MCKTIPPRFQNSPKGLDEMGYIPPAFLAWVEIVGGIFPLKILKYFTIWWNFVWRKKIPPHKLECLPFYGWFSRYPAISAVD